MPSAVIGEDGREGPRTGSLRRRSADGRAHATAGRNARARCAQASTRRRLRRARVRLLRLDHRRGLALRRPVRVVSRRPGSDHLVADRRQRDDAARPDPCRAREHVPRRRGQRSVPALRLRKRRRLHERLGRVPRRGDGGADHGRGHASVRVELRLIADHRLGRTAGADGPGLRCRGGAAAALRHDQRPGCALARRDEQARRLLEDLRPGSDRRGAARHLRAS